MTSPLSEELRHVTRRVAAMNLAFFGVEFAVATAIGSVSLFADSIDFLEDTAINLLILLALGCGPRRRAILGGVLAGLLLVPAAATAWPAWQAWSRGTVPEPAALTATGLGALAVNLTCALMLARWRDGASSLTRADFLSARNDVAANVAIIAAGMITAIVASPLPDLIVGPGILLMSLDAAVDILRAARREWRGAEP